MNLFTSPLTPCKAFSEVSSRETGSREIQVIIFVIWPFKNRKLILVFYPVKPNYSEYCYTFAKLSQSGLFTLEIKM